ncbi:hypothetical protein [Daejeonella sp. H1SJ63]|jgi:hypothetical protein|uniref:hypothetical protein n=1 Tax=Daejeonella sp. H1SJ63 TaxID=3034145 RepID=UPI0023EB20AA|nr:hypothetical protein [Daejeonella sp. H1SJ63]
MKDIIFKNWNIIRFLRLGIGMAIVVQAIMASDVMIALAGLLFTGMAVFNAGCCGTSGCATPVSKVNTAKDITYEEVK